jgi:PPK2 family polyphosphate:nucleotide phosphotransferase
MNDLKAYLVKPGHRVKWSDVDPNDKGHFRKKEDALDETQAFSEELDCYQERLYAERTRSLLIILQAIDTGGKDGTIRHVMTGVNPQGCVVTSFKEPSREELSHDFLWRIHSHVPEKGYIGIFNRSHYEDVLITRVHDTISDKEAKKRYKEINDFEKFLTASGTTILKFYLAISKDEQRKRLQARADDPDKNWKFSVTDLRERKSWDKYQKAYAESISATSTPNAPWYLIPANHKWYRNYLVAKVIAKTLRKMNPKTPAGPSGVNFKKLKIR